MGGLGWAVGGEEICGRGAHSGGGGGWVVLAIWMWDVIPFAPFVVTGILELSCFT